MNSHRDRNLSDEAFSELLAQAADAEADAEVLALKSALNDYRTETMNWAERRSATQPSLAPRAKAGGWIAVPQWSLAAVAVVAVAAGVVHFAGYGAEDIAPAASLIVNTSATARPDDIAADNQLLGSIDNALRHDNAPPVIDFAAKPVKQASRSTQAGLSD